MRKSLLSGPLIACFIIASSFIWHGAAVAIAAPIAEFSGSPVIWNAPSRVIFNDNSSGTVTSWRWNFGDGTESAERNPVHLYETAGTYTVSLTVTGDGGTTTTMKSDYITMEEHIPVGEEYLIQVDPSAHQRYGLYYPATYKFRLPAGSQGLTAQYRYWEGSWKNLTEQKQGDIFNGIDAVRFDYGNDFAYVSVRLSRASDAIHVRVVDSQGQPVPWQFDSITRYYDDRNAVVTLTLDDWNTSFADDFDTALDYLFNDGLYFSAAIISNDVYWNRVQQKIDQYGDHLEIASHTMNHPCTAADYATHGYQVETAGSRDALRQNLRFGASPYVPLLVEPCGYSDDQLQAALTAADYLLSRSANNNPVQGMVFSEWDPNAGRYSRGAVTYDDDVNLDDAKLLADTNAAFDKAIQAGGIYHLMDHPSKGFWHPDSYLLQHLHYISGRSDIWYVPFGQLYLYHFLQEMQGNLSIKHLSSSSLAANFSAAPLSGNSPLTVSFTDKSTGNATGWFWDFGDGNKSTQQNPVHLYRSGTYTVKLTVTGSGGADSKSASNFITVKHPAPVASFTASPLSGYEPLSVSFTDTSTGNITDWSWDFGDSVMSTEEDPVHVYQAGTYTVKLTVTGAGGSNSASSSNYITVKPTIPASSRITAPANGASFTAPATIPIGVTASAGSGASVKKVEFLSGGSVVGTDTAPPYNFNWGNVPAGNYSLTAKVTDSQGRTATSIPVNVSVVNVAVKKRDQSITVTKAAPATATFGSAFTVAATAPAGPVTYSSAGGCSNTAATFTMTSGSIACTVIFDQTGNADYNPANQKSSTTGAAKATQVIGVGTAPPATAVLGACFAVAASASGGAVTYSSAGGCSNTGATFTMTSAAIPCTVRFDQGGNADYSAASQVTSTVAVSKIDQSITWNSAPPVSAAFGTSFTVAATAPGGAISYSSAGGCGNNGATFTMTSGSTSCTVICDQPGSANYPAAPQKSATVTAVKGQQTVTVTVPPPDSAQFGSIFTVAATAPGGAVTYASGGGCSNAGASFTVTSGATGCLVRYTQSGSADYSSAPEKQYAIPVTKAPQKISVTTPAPASSASGSSFTVAATAPAGQVSYSSSGGCTNAGATFTMTGGVTPCTVRYSQPGNADYLAATEITSQTTAVMKEQFVTITTPAPATAVFGTKFTVAATAPGGPVSYSSAGGCTNSGATFTMTSGTTPCAVRFDQAGSAEYGAAPRKTSSTAAIKADQGITITIPAPVTSAVGSTFTVAGKAQGGEVIYSSVGGCSNSGATFTMTSGGAPCTVSFDQAGSADYNPAHYDVSVAAAVVATVASGDFNGDGVVDIRDAMGALRISVGLEAAAPEVLSRIDVAPLVKGKPAPDGKIDVGDVIVILRKSVGLSSW